MVFENLAKLIFKEIKPRLETNKGLYVFAKERAKFEGWLKVELCNILSKYFKDIAPEKRRIDITFGNWAIELKTVNTNYRCKNVKSKARPITDNINNVIKDIEKLKSYKSHYYTNKVILFVVFPVKKDNEFWQKHLLKIEPLCKKIVFCDFNLKGKIPALIYLGTV